MNKLTCQIHAILFFTAEPQSFDALAKLCGVPVADIAPAVQELVQSLQNSGVVVLVQNNTVGLAIDESMSEFIAAMQKESFAKELSKAQGETLAIVAYMEGATKTDIEFIRGVNSVYSIRALVARGLIEAKGNGRSVSYVPSIDLLREFGITSTAELPEFAAQSAKIKQLLTQKDIQ
ncbi:MAG: SMC-Scp complex subunit ScpB [bacterium]